ncbi:MAG: hypothetical protein ABIL58_14065 [Pseudomonadota bacterium]
MTFMPASSLLDNVLRREGQVIGKIVTPKEVLIMIQRVGSETKEVERKIGKSRRPGNTGAARSLLSDLNGLFDR